MSLDGIDFTKLQSYYFTKLTSIVENTIQYSHPHLGLDLSKVKCRKLEFWKTTFNAKDTEALVQALEHRVQVSDGRDV